jgi:hypothetical protein
MFRFQTPTVNINFEYLITPARASSTCRFDEVSFSNNADDLNFPVEETLPCQQRPGQQGQGGISCEFYVPEFAQSRRVAPS